MTVPFDLAEQAAGVLIHGYRDGRYLAAAIELVSEGNKDRPEAREAFVARCETYLQSGVGLVIVDAVTSRTSNLHDELMRRLAPEVAPWGERLYATAYRPSGKNGSAQLTIWQEPMALGVPLADDAALVAPRPACARPPRGDLRRHLPPAPPPDRGAVTMAVYFVYRCHYNNAPAAASSPSRRGGTC